MFVVVSGRAPKPMTDRACVAEVSPREAGVDDGRAISPVRAVEVDRSTILEIAPRDHPRAKRREEPGRNRTAVDQAIGWPTFLEVDCQVRVPAAAFEQRVAGDCRG